jgi:hypothetical protein
MSAIYKVLEAIQRRLRRWYNGKGDTERRAGSDELPPSSEKPADDPK